MDRYEQKGQEIVQIDDQNTGLRYKLNKYENTCAVSIFSDSTIEGQSPADFFMLSDKPEIQYSGQVFRNLF